MGAMNDDAIVWCNGALMRADEVRVSPFDLGVTVGVGVFETLIAYEGKLFAWERHYERMEEGVRVLGIDDSHLLSEEKMREVMEEVVQANGLADGRARVRISLSGGANAFAGGDRSGNLMVTAVVSLQPVPLALLAVVDLPCHEGAEFAQVKSASFSRNVLAWREAHRMGADEAVRLNTRGFLCEGAMSNLFLVKDGAVLTPPLESGCLTGVTRGIVLEICYDLGLDVVEDFMGLSALEEADEIFITSSAREVQAARLMVDDSSGNKGTSGPVTRQIAEAYQEMLRL